MSDHEKNEKNEDPKQEEAEDVGRPLASQENDHFVWKQGDDLRDVWRITDAKQLDTIPLPNPHKMPCEASVLAIRAFQKRGLKITKLALSWWLTFNLEHVLDVADIITVEEALLTAIRAQHPTIFMILAEQLSPEALEKHKSNVLEWYKSTLAKPNQTTALLETILGMLKWI